MTPNMGMEAPKGMAPAAPQAGLAALAQPNTAPRGKSSDNMGQVMALARKMSDAQLADVLKGKSLDIPQYVAMTEAMGRKQLRTAVEGAQAQQGAQQASLKDRLMAEQEQAAMPQAGLDQLPAPGMMPQGMAGGGIVAFDEGGDVDARNPLAYLNPGDLWDKLKGYIAEKQAAVPKTPLQEKIAAEKSKNMSPAELDALAQGQGVFPEGSPALPGGLTPDSLGRYVAKADTPPPKKSGLESLVGGKGAAPSEVPQNQAAQDYLAKLEGLTTKQREGLGAIKQQGQGEALMQLASGILSSPTLAGGLAKGMPLVASTSAASRKEQAELNKMANEYDLNLAKAREAAEAGDMDRAFQYKKLADENKYRMAALNKPSDSMQLLQALGDPKLMERFKEMQAAKKPTDVVPKGTALKEYNDMVANDYTKAFRKQYPTFESYYNELSGGTSSGGFDLSAAAKAELARRNK
jgi:hypothetical protein